MVKSKEEMSTVQQSLNVFNKETGLNKFIINKLIIFLKFSPGSSMSEEKVTEKEYEQRTDEKYVYMYIGDSITTCCDCS
jgi:hypothetical protein